MCLHVGERKQLTLNREVTGFASGDKEEAGIICLCPALLNNSPPMKAKRSFNPSHPASSLTTLWMGGSRWGDSKRPVRSLLFTLPPKHHPANSRRPPCSSEATFSSAGCDSWPCFPMAVERFRPRRRLVHPLAHDPRQLCAIDR